MTFPSTCLRAPTLGREAAADPTPSAAADADPEVLRASGLEALPGELQCLIHNQLNLQDRLALRSTSRALYFADPYDHLQTFQSTINAQIAAFAPACERARLAEGEAVRQRDRACVALAHTISGLPRGDARIGPALALLGADPALYAALSGTPAAANLIASGLRHAWDAAPAELRQQLGELDPVWRRFPHGLIGPGSGADLVNWRGLAQALVTLDGRSPSRGGGAAPDAVSEWTDTVMRQLDQRLLLQGLRDQCVGHHAESPRIRDIDQSRNRLALGLLRLTPPEARAQRLFLAGPAGHTQDPLSCFDWPGMLRAPSSPALVGRVLSLMPPPDLPEALAFVSRRFSALRQNWGHVADAAHGPVILRDMRAQADRCDAGAQAAAHRLVERLARAWR